MPLRGRDGPRRGRHDPALWARAPTTGRAFPCPTGRPTRAFAKPRRSLRPTTARPRPRALRDAHPVAAGLGAAPLVADIEALARRARVRLTTAADGATAATSIGAGLSAARDGGPRARRRRTHQPRDRRRCTSAPRPPARTCRTSSPSSASPTAARPRRRPPPEPRRRSRLRPEQARRPPHAHSTGDQSARCAPAAHDALAKSRGCGHLTGAGGVRSRRRSESYNLVLRGRRSACAHSRDEPGHWAQAAAGWRHLALAYMWRATPYCAEPRNRCGGAHHRQDRQRRSPTSSPSSGVANGDQVNAAAHRQNLLSQPPTT